MLNRQTEECPYCGSDNTAPDYAFATDFPEAVGEKVPCACAACGQSWAGEWKRISAKNLFELLDSFAPEDDEDDTPEDAHQRLGALLSAAFDSDSRWMKDWAAVGFRLKELENRLAGIEDEVPIHMLTRDGKLAECGVSGMDEACHDAREVTCPACKESRRYKVQMGLKVSMDSKGEG
jgi:hypothetical protein